MKNYVHLLNAAREVARASSATITELSDAIVELQNELAEERYRHDRYVDYSIYEGKRLESLLNLVRTLKDMATGEQYVPGAMILGAITAWEIVDEMSVKAREH